MEEMKNNQRGLERLKTSRNDDTNRLDLGVGLSIVLPTTAMQEDDQKNALLLLELLPFRPIASSIGTTPPLQLKRFFVTVKIHLPMCSLDSFKNSLIILSRMFYLLKRGVFQIPISSQYLLKHGRALSLNLHVFSMNSRL
jgi:hypothetical protein